MCCPVGFQHNAQNKVSVCRAAEGGDAVVSLTDDNAADGNLGKRLCEMSMVVHWLDWKK